MRYALHNVAGQSHGSARRVVKFVDMMNLCHGGSVFREVIHHRCKILIDCSEDIDTYREV